MKKSAFTKCQAVISVLAVVACLLIPASNVWAIGDSGGCTFPSVFVNKIEFGTVAEVKAEIENGVTYAWERLKPEARKILKSNPQALHAWQKEAWNTWIGSPIHCSHGEWALDRAVANGNLDVVRWLLDANIDPHAINKQPGDKSTIFSRCSFAMQGRRPDGLSKEMARKRKIEAYRMLIAYGADINISQRDKRIDDPLKSCLDPEMYPILKEHGATVSNSRREIYEVGVAIYAVDIKLYALRHWIDSIGSKPSTNQLSIVRELARDGNNDLRGTTIEANLASATDFLFKDRPDDPKLQGRYEQMIWKNEQLASIVRLSPGIFPGHPAKPDDVPDQFSPFREVCFFPEITAFPDFDFISVIRELKLEPDTRKPAPVDITIGETKKPVLLVLFNQNYIPTNWIIRQAKDARILGIIVLTHHRGQGKNDTVTGFDPKRPIYKGSGCHVSLAEPHHTESGRVELHVTPELHNPDSLNPFLRKGSPTEISSDSDKAVVGDVLSAGDALVTWPDDIRGWSVPVTFESAALTGSAALSALERQAEVRRANSHIAIKWIEEHRSITPWSTFSGKERWRFPEFWDAYMPGIYGDMKVILKELAKTDTATMFLPGSEFLSGTEYGKISIPQNVTVYFYQGKKSSELDGTCLGPRCKCDSGDCLQD